MIGGLIGGIARLFVEVVIEFLIKGAGYCLCRPFSGRRLDPDDVLVSVVGLGFWAVVVFLLAR